MSRFMTLHENSDHFDFFSVLPCSFRYVYSCSPVDHWYGAIDVQEVWIDDPKIEQEILLVCASAMEAIRQSGAGWEGDIREGPFIYFMARNDGGGCVPYVGLKQDNNGDTFFASEYPLTWLHEPEAWELDDKEWRKLRG